MRILIFSLLLCTFLWSCKKYPDGPTVSLLSRETRLVNTWSCEKVLVNNLESTPYYTKYSYNYGADNSYSEYNGFNSIKGTWAFSGNEDSLIVKFNTNQTLHSFKILRLKNRSIWLLEDRNSASYEWHLKSN